LAVQSASIDPQDILGIRRRLHQLHHAPTDAHGTPLCLLDPWSKDPQAWPKLWKHHGAKTQTDRINQIAQERNEPWLARYGGAIGLEWFFPKVLEALETLTAVYEETRQLDRSRRLVRLATHLRTLPPLQ
jgi:L-ribulokinase